MLNVGIDFIKRVWLPEQLKGLGGLHLEEFYPIFTEKIPGPRLHK